MNKLARAATRIVQAPFVMCERSVARMQGPLKQHIDACEAKGDDVCAAVWHEYADAQMRLLPYRCERLVHECRHVFSGKVALATLSGVEVLLLLRFATKCFMLFLVFVLLGRRTVFPPLAPTSPFVEEVVKRWNPNQIRAFSRTVSDTIDIIQFEEAELAALEQTRQRRQCE